MFRLLLCLESSRWQIIIHKCVLQTPHDQSAYIWVRVDGLGWLQKHQYCVRDDEVRCCLIIHFWSLWMKNNNVIITKLLILWQFLGKLSCGPIEKQGANQTGSANRSDTLLSNLLKFLHALFHNLSQGFTIFLVKRIFFIQRPTSNCSVTTESLHFLFYPLR